MKVYTLDEVARGGFERPNRAEDLREHATKRLSMGERILLTDLIKELVGEFNINAYASVRNCFTPRNGFKITKQGRRLYVERGLPI